MKGFTITMLLLHWSLWLVAQNNYTDSLRQIIRETKIDSSRISSMIKLSSYFRKNNSRDSALAWAHTSLKKAREKNLIDFELRSLENLGNIYIEKNPDSAIQLAQEGLRISAKGNLKKEELNMLGLLVSGYLSHKLDSAIIYAKHGVLLARELKLPDKESNFLFVIASINFIVGNYPNAIETYLSIYRLGQSSKREDLGVEGLVYIGLLYRTMGDHRQALRYHFMTRDIQEKLGAHENRLWTLNNIAYEYASLGRFDSTQYFIQKTDLLADSLKFAQLPGGILNDRGDIYSAMGNEDLALLNYRNSLPELMREDPYNLCLATFGLANLFFRKNVKDSSLHYARKTFAIAKQSGFLLWEQKASTFLVDFHKMNGSIDSAFYYSQNATMIKDSLFNLQRLTEFQNISFSEQIREQEINQEREKFRSRLGLSILSGCLILFLILVIFLWRNARQKQNAKNKIEKAYEELRSTQAQLIQSEKMASLGELTAGIAHEIQNPLNFINNFAEVNKELLLEMNEEIGKGNLQGAKTIANDLIDNEEKINHHGKRADAIVKGMLQHSRTSTGQKEPTDINALVDEYVRLSYHGLRAKDKSFNTTIQTDFDPSIGKINIISQDIGRVLLNLLNNAFYSVTEKKKKFDTGYEPTVSITTRHITLGTGSPKGALITLSDNGLGIPEKVRGKIFQPFFTTKPSGKGTGLGLSLSYDIITQGHGGQIELETKEDEFAKFIIRLPG